MLSRLFTALFYAIVFFALGAWSGGSLHKIGQFAWRAANEISAPSGKVHTATPTPAAASQAAPTVAAPADAAPAAAPADAVPAAIQAPPADLGPARAAFASGDLSGAIAAYLAVIKDHPADADALGELGNVYFNAGQTDNAARQFQAAALALIEAGEPARARALLPAIRPYAPALATAVEARLAAAGPGQ